LRIPVKYLANLLTAGDGTGFISATRVRAALRAGDLQTVARQVPNTTLAFLRSHEGAAIVRRIRN
jgi:citrate lyase synthetase